MGAKPIHGEIRLCAHCESFLKKSGKYLRRIDDGEKHGGICAICRHRHDRTAIYTDIPSWSEEEKDADGD